VLRDPRVVRVVYTRRSFPYPSVMQTTSGISASRASMIPAAATGGGTNMTLAVAPVCLTPSDTSLNTGRLRCWEPASARGQRLPSTLFLSGRLALWICSAHDFCAILDRLLSMECPLLARKALKQNLGVSVNSQVVPCLGVGRGGGDGSIASGGGRSQRPRSAGLESLHLCKTRCVGNKLELWKSCQCLFSEGWLGESIDKLSDPSCEVPRGRRKRVHRTSATVKHNAPKCR
jgi:hypothetical protein